MKFALWSKRTFVIMMIIALVFSGFGLQPYNVSAAPVKVVVVGNLQSELTPPGATIPTADWDPAAEATQMTDMGNGYYAFNGTLRDEECRFLV